MTLPNWIARRLLLAIPVIGGITTLTFALIQLAPGDPVYLLAGDGGSPSYYEDMRVKFGLDRPLVEQFVLYLRAAATGDLGHSFTYDAPVSAVILGHVPASILLGTAAMIIAVLGGTGLALASVIWRVRAIEGAIRVASAVMYAAPVYWTGQILIILIGVQLALLPVGGMTSARETLAGTPWAIDLARHLVLPAVTLALPFMAVILRVTRASLADTLDEPFVQGARARGLSHRQVLLRHALPHAAVAIVTLAGQHAPQIVAGAAITEYLFGWPGVGSVVLHASMHRDYPLVTAAFLMISSSVVLFNALSDAVCAWLDPRIRLA